MALFGGWCFTRNASLFLPFRIMEFRQPLKKVRSTTFFKHPLNFSARLSYGFPITILWFLSHEHLHGQVIHTGRRENISLRKLTSCRLGCQLKNIHNLQVENYVLFGGQS